MLAPELRPWIASTGQDGKRYSMQEFAGDGVRTSFEFNFAGGYIDPANVRAYTYVAATGVQTPVTVVLTGPNTISVVPAVPVGTFLVVYRDTDKSQPLVDFVDGAVMSEANLDKVARQAVYATAEMVDRFYVTEQNVGELTAEVRTATERSQLALDRASDAQLRAADAQQTAHDALAGVAGAEAAAALATAAAQAATTAATDANDAVSRIEGKADSAVTTANAASGVANAIDGKAQSALDASAAAVTTANAARATAEGIDGKATTALSNSATAMAEAADAKAAAAENVLAMGLVLWWPQRASIPAGFVPADGQTLSRATYPDFVQDLLAGKFPVVSEADWNSDPLKRGSYTVGDGGATFRVPDLNGKSAGSLGRVFLSGDGVNADQPGAIQRDAMQPIVGAQSVAYGVVSGAGTGPFNGSRQGDGASRSRPEYPLSTGSDTFRFDSSLVTRTAPETRPSNVAGCHIIRVAGKASNPGSVDIGALATEVATLSGNAARAEQRAIRLSKVSAVTTRAVQLSGKSEGFIATMSAATFILRPYDVNGDPAAVSAAGLSFSCDTRSQGLGGRDQASAFPLPAVVHLYAVLVGSSIHLVASLRPQDQGPLGVGGATHYCYLTTILHNAAGWISGNQRGSLFSLKVLQNTSGNISSGNRYSIDMQWGFPYEYARTAWYEVRAAITAGAANAAITTYLEYEQGVAVVGVQAYAALNSSAFNYVPAELAASRYIWTYIALSGPSGSYGGTIFLRSYTVYNNSD